jgi:hypothetical protein
MDFDVLPGPSRAELARTALARAAAAAVTAAGPDRRAFAAVPVRVNAAGQPVLLPAAGSALAGLLTAGPAAVSVAAPDPLWREAPGILPPVSGSAGQPDWRHRNA